MVAKRENDCGGGPNGRAEIISRDVIVWALTALVYSLLWFIRFTLAVGRGVMDGITTFNANRRLNEATERELLDTSSSMRLLTGFDLCSDIVDNLATIVANVQAPAPPFPPPNRECCILLVLFPSAEFLSS